MYNAKIATLQKQFTNVQDLIHWVRPRAEGWTTERLQKELDAGKVVWLHAAVCWVDSVDVEGVNTIWHRSGKEFRGGPKNWNSVVI